MPSGKLKSASFWQRLDSGRLPFIIALLATAGLAAWLTQAHANRQQRAKALETMRDRVQLKIQILANTVQATLFASASLEVLDGVPPANPGGSTLPETETDNFKVHQAEAALKRQLDTILAWSENTPGVLSATRELRDYLVGPMRFHNELLIGEGAGDATNRLTLFASRQPAVRENLDRLFSQFSAQVDHARDAETRAARTIAIISGLLLIPALLVIGLVVSRPGLAGTRAPLQELSAALSRMRRGDFSRKLAWDRNDELGEAASELDRLCDHLGQGLPQMRDTAGVAGNACAEVAKSVREQRETMTELTAQSSEIADASDVVQMTAKNLAGQAAKVQTALQSTEHIAATAVTAAGKRDSVLHNLAESGLAAAEKLSAADEKAGAFGPLINTIGKVADEANLLSLNAAIEAEKAGEYGLGFTVVAMEIRRFAEQALSAANDLDKIAGELRSIIGASADQARKSSEDTRAAARSAEEFDRHLQLIARELHSLNPVCVSTLEASREHAAGAQRLAEKLETLSKNLRAACSTAQLDVTTKELEKTLRDLNSALANWRTTPS